jgi:hypothetical protein
MVRLKVLAFWRSCDVETQRINEQYYFEMVEEIGTPKLLADLKSKLRIAKPGTEMLGAKMSVAEPIFAATILSGDIPVREIDPREIDPPLFINYLAFCAAGKILIALVVTAPTLEKLFSALEHIAQDWVRVYGAGKLIR